MIGFSHWRSYRPWSLNKGTTEAPRVTVLTFQARSPGPADTMRWSSHPTSVIFYILSLLSSACLAVSVLFTKRMFHMESLKIRKFLLSK